MNDLNVKFTCPYCKQEMVSTVPFYFGLLLGQKAIHNCHGCNKDFVGIVSIEIKSTSKAIED